LIQDEPEHTMTKAVSLSLSFVFLLAAVAASPAQTSATDSAINEAVLRQANTIVLRQKLAEAKATAARGDLPAAAKEYLDASKLVEQIGSGIDAEAAETISGLDSTWLTLARQSQSEGNLREADTQVKQVLNVDPQNTVALAFKKQNDQMLGAMKGKMPSASALEQIPVVAEQKTQAGTLVQDGKLLYEMGKLDEAEVKLQEAQKLDPDNTGAYYYLNLINQARFGRESMVHTEDTITRMKDVEKQWVLPSNKNLPPESNPYATTNLVYTGPGRQAIVSKLDRIRLDSISYDPGVPLSEVIRDLQEKVRSRDPERKGINFLINPNPDNSGSPIAAAAAAPGAYATAQPVVDQATGLPAAPATGAGEAVDVGTVLVKLSLTDVRLADLLDAICLVADHPIKYSIEEYAVVFSTKGPESPQLFTRSFRVDPNIFYSGLESVSGESFGSTGGSTGGGGGGTGGGGGGGGGGSSSSSTSSGAAIAVVNAFPGASTLRSTGTGGGTGGGGGGGATGGVGSPVGTGVGGTGGNANSALTAGGGVRYVTTPNLSSDVSVTARAFFTTLGVNLNAPVGKSVFFNDRLGLLIVKATEDDLDTIERAIQAIDAVPPQVHIKTRFIEVQQTDNKALGFDWYLGNFINGAVQATGGSAPSLNVPVSAANPLGAYPGSTALSEVAATAADGQIGNLVSANQGIPTLATVTGILTNPNFRVVLHALESRSGFETLAEPEVTTISGRQTEMRATQLLTVITSFTFTEGSAPVTAGVGAATTP